MDGIIFNDCNLQHVSFSYSSLKSSFFKKSKLQDINFFNTELYEINFYKAEIKKLCFKNAKLIKANFEKTKIESTDFSFADLREAIFIGSIIKDTNFSYCNFLEVKGIIEILKTSSTLTGSIIKYEDNLFTNDEINKLKEKGIIFIKYSPLIENRKSNRLIIKPREKNLYFSYDVSGFKIDMKETRELNPLYDFVFPGEPFLKSETEIENTIARLYRRQS